MKKRSSMGIGTKRDFFLRQLCPSFKKWIFSILVLVGVIASVNSATDWEGNLYVIPSVWRSSVTSTSDQLVSITTQPANFGGVIVTSAGVNQANVGIYNSNNVLIVSTINALTTSAFPYGYGVIPSTSGLKYINTGGTPASITILWQYQNKHDPGK